MIDTARQNLQGQGHPFSVFLLPWVSLSLIINKAAIIQKFSLGYDIIALLTPT